MKPNIFGSKGVGDRPQICEANIPYPDPSGGHNGNHKILVAYASRFGTTREVAEVIGRALCRGGARVEVKWIKNIKNLEKYTAVIIGSAIQYDNWMPEARKFVTFNHPLLSKLPVAFFFTCLTLSRRNEKTEQQALAYSDKLYALHPRVKPSSVGRFAGVLDYSKFSFFSRLIFKSVFSVIGIREGDYRDWDAIRAWAGDVYSRLNSSDAKKGIEPKMSAPAVISLNSN